MSTRMNMVVIVRRASVAGKEGRQALRHATRVLDLQQVSRLSEDERLCVRKPPEHSRVNLAVGGQADRGVGVGADDGKYRLLDARGVLLGELPLRDRREF